MHRCRLSDPPLVYVLIILLLLLFVLHQFAGLCSQQKRMGNICPGRPGRPGSPPERPPAAFLGSPRAAALLLYLGKPFFRDCRTQQGPRGPPARGAEEQRGCPGGWLLGKPGGRGPVAGRSSCRALPRPPCPCSCP